MIYCREATLQDGKAMSQLSHQLGYTSTTEEIIERLNRLIPLTDHYVYVAEIDSAVVGWGHVQGRHSIESASFAEIGGLVVDEQVQLSLNSQRRVGQHEYNSGKHPLGRVERRDSLPARKAIQDAPPVTRAGSGRYEDRVHRSLLCVKDMEQGLQTSYSEPI